MNTATHTHAFTLAGLGEAPFRFVGINENLFRAGDIVKAGGCCNFCSTGIRYECIIVSADGINSVVGTDCIRKVGDKGLVKAVNALKNKQAREKRKAKFQAEEIARTNAERAANGGLTDWEREQAERMTAEKKRAASVAPALAVLAELAIGLTDGRGGFCDSIAKDWKRGRTVSPNASIIAAEVIAKKSGRKGSKAYISALELAEAKIGAAQEAVKASFAGEPAPSL